MKVLDKLKNVPLVYEALFMGRNTYYYGQYLLFSNRMKKTLSQVRSRDPKRKIKVLFIIQYVPAWNKLEPVYKRMKEDENFTTKLICVPSSLNDSRAGAQKKTINDTYEYFINEGYECIDACEGDGWYDIEAEKPDFVFHSRPYNALMPKPYRSSVISRYALICNVLYAVTLTKRTEEVTLDVGYYKDVFCYFAFNKAEMDYFKKRFKRGIKKKAQICLPYGGTCLEQVYNAQKEKSESVFEKTVIWTPRWSTDKFVGGSNFFRYSSTIMRLAEEYKNVLFIIRPHPLMFGNFINTGEMTEKEVEDFKKYCQSTPNVQLDEQKEYTERFWDSDMLISDNSSMVAEYYVTGKPIIYCESDPPFEHKDYAVKMYENSYYVTNEKELEKSFRMLCAGSDEKKEKRGKSIDTLFGDYLHSSEKILGSLKKIAIGK